MGGRLVAEYVRDRTIKRLSIVKKIFNLLKSERVIVIVDEKFSKRGRKLCVKEVVFFMK